MKRMKRKVRGPQLEDCALVLGAAVAGCAVEIAVAGEGEAALGTGAVVVIKFMHDIEIAGGIDGKNHAVAEARTRSAVIGGSVKHGVRPLGHGAVGRAAVGAAGEHV